MLISKKIIILIFFIVTGSSLSAQYTLDKETLKLLDSSLALLDMNRKDLVMPWDFKDNDIHRLRLIKDLFNDPLLIFSKTSYYKQLFQDFDPETSEGIIDTILKDLEFKPYEHYNLDIAYASHEMNRMLRANVDSAVSFYPGLIIKQYISPMLRFINAVQYDVVYKDKGAREFIIENLDSLIINDEEGGGEGKLNVHQLEDIRDLNYKKSRLFFYYADFMKKSMLYELGISLYLKVNDITDNILSNLNMVEDSIKTTEFNTIYGKIAIGGSGDDHYSGNYFLIVDLGGNDSYNLKGQTIREYAYKYTSVIVDIDGNDTYNGGSCTLGGAAFGVNILIDHDGDDIYKAGDISLGSGIFGLGILTDLDGSDIYYGKNFTQGCGLFGIGILSDKTGNDIYNAYSYGQGFGYTRGFGILIDNLGNDYYLSSSPAVDVLRYEDHYISFTQGAALGYRPIASGGIGILADLKGNDQYVSDIYGQGTAYWYSMGALLDDEGTDRYQSYQYAQGSGVHLAHALLRDKKGDDIYISHGVSQGCGHDVASGFLVDESGSDQYMAESLSLGAGNANAVSVFIDVSGDDGYIAFNESNTMGYSDYRRGYGMIGLFIDGGGNDLYGSNKNNEKIKYQSTYGLFADFDIYAKDKVTSTNNESNQLVVLTSTIDSLFTQASAAHLKYQKDVMPAREKIVELGKDAIPFLALKLNTDFARERHALEDILVKMYEKDTIAVKGLILDSIYSNNYRTLMMVTEVAGKKKIEETLDRMVSLLSNDDWRIRAQAAQQIGRIGNPLYASELLPILKEDKHSYPRSRAAYSIAVLDNKLMKETAAIALKDSTQIVRNNFIIGIKDSKPDLSIIMELLEKKIPKYSRGKIASIIPEIEMDDKEFNNFKKDFKSLDNEIRKSVYISIIESGSEEWQNRLKSLLFKSERDRDLQQMVNQMLQER